MTWDDILWAAVTVGRPNRQYVFRHGDASIYEAFFRLSLVRMALEQSAPAGRRLKRTEAVKTLDPTEKGAVNYFLGMIFCKLFAAKLLNTPWLLHLDAFRPELDVVLAGRSRPDMVGEEDGSGTWHAFECKGRISPPDSSVKKKAKSQAQRLVSVNGTPCKLHIGSVTYFRNDTLQFYWRDPLPEQRNPIKVHFTGDAWRYYYAPVVELISANSEYQAIIENGSPVYLNNLDLAVGIHPDVARALFDQQWLEARYIALETYKDTVEKAYQPDGLTIRAGSSWQRRFEEVYT